MRETKVKYILFPRPHLNYILFFAYFVSSMIKQGILKIFKGQNNLAIPFFDLYIYNLCDFLSLFPYLLIKKNANQKSKINLDTELNNDDNIQYIYNNFAMEKLNKSTKKIKLNIFLISIFDFIAQISTVIYYLIKGKAKIDVEEENLNFLLIFNIIFLFLFSRLILHTLFLRHHYFCFFVFIFCLFILIIIDIIEIKVENKDLDNIISSIIYLLVRIFAASLYSLEDVLAKVMFYNFYFSPYYLLLIKAIIQFFYLIIFSLPFFFIKFKDQNGEEMLIFSMFGNIFENKINILFYIIYLINSFFYNILNFFLIERFSPNHKAIARIFENFGILFIDLAKDSEGFDNNFIIRMIIYILLIISSFIFNEFLVINICNLANDTKLFLDYKEEKDLSLIGKTNEDDEIGSNNNDEISYTLSFDKGIEIEMT
jgi:hypothetical protein